MRITHQRNRLVGVGVLSEKDSQIWAGPKKPNKEILDEIISRNSDQLVLAMSENGFVYGEIYASQKFGGGKLRTFFRPLGTRNFEFFSPPNCDSLGVFSGKDPKDALENMIQEVGTQNLLKNLEDGSGVSHDPKDWDMQEVGSESTIQITDTSIYPFDPECLDSRITKTACGNFRISSSKKGVETCHKIRLSVAEATKAVFLLKSFIEENRDKE